MARSVIFLNFKFNQKKLTETVCVNKNKPENCCAAKCHLDNEIKKEDKRQNDNSNSIKDKAEKSELRTGLMTFSFLNLGSKVQPVFSYLMQLPQTNPSAVFHPPAF